MIDHYGNNEGNTGFQRNRYNNSVPSVNTYTYHIMLADFVICDEEMNPRVFPTYSEASKFMATKRQLNGRARATTQKVKNAKKLKVYG